MDIVITIPSSIEWDEYKKELDSVIDGKNVLNFKVSNFPKMCKVGDKCYLNYKGYVKGWMTIVGFSDKNFICNTTGKDWSGKFIERSGPFHEIKPIPMKGFQGFRYFKSNESLTKFNDFINKY